jgi:hypothetical protein
VSSASDSTVIATVARHCAELHRIGSSSRAASTGSTSIQARMRRTNGSNRLRDAVERISTPAGRLRDGALRGDGAQLATRWSVAVNWVPSDELTPTPSREISI